LTIDFPLTKATKQQQQQEQHEIKVVPNQIGKTHQTGTKSEWQTQVDPDVGREPTLSGGRKKR
jgi:hypothetical protein